MLSNLEPASVFRFFEEICSIPHGSFHVDKISDYLVDYAKERNLKYQQDEAKNVIIFKEATKGYENSEPVILQGHMDMVAVKEADSDKDLEVDGLDLLVEGDFLMADKTSLGGDDGIALAYALAIMDDDTIPHPPIESVFTTNEEVGLLGATAIDVSGLKGRRLINLDSEEEGVFIVSCAGGSRVDCKFPLIVEERDGAEISIEISNLMGGHSGVEINKGRLNANKAMLRMLLELNQVMDLCIISMNGGEKDNTIAASAKASILVERGLKEMAADLLVSYAENLLNVYDSTEPNMEFDIGDVDKYGAMVVPENVSSAFLSAMANMPEGIIRMNQEILGMVETSLNLGTVKTTEEEIILYFSTRSSIESELTYLEKQLKALTELVGGSVFVHGRYPGWEYKSQSKLREVFVESYRALYGEEAVLAGIHAGLECGLFAKKIEDLDAISIGCQMYDIHSTRERLSISSVERTWKLLLHVLKNLK